MRFLRARIKGAIGLYRGSNLKEIDIDFTKCKNNIILIVGSNGSGKSTLLSLLHPFPDPHNMFLLNEEGFKELDYLMDNGTIYRLVIQYPLNRYGERTTTKAYISKQVGVEVTELNPNGNVSSYKERLREEFGLDLTLMALSTLAIDDKGIVSKTPSERKKFVGSLIDIVEAYNFIYKSLNKKSSVYKSIINNLASKISSTGDLDTLNANLISINSRIDLLSKNRNDLVKQLSDAESLIRLTDPDNTIQNKYRELYSQSMDIKRDIETINIFINKYSSGKYSSYVSSLKICQENQLQLSNRLAVLNNELTRKSDELQTLLQDKEEESRALNIKINKVKSLRSQYNFDEMLKQLKTTRDKIKNYINILNKLGISEDSTLTGDEFLLGLNTLKDIKNQVDVIRSFAYDSQISLALNYIDNGESIMNDIISKETQIDELKKSIEKIKSDISYNNGLLDKTSILLQRPDECSTDNCPFIKDALQASSLNPKDNLDKLSEKLPKLQDQLRILQDEKKELDEVSKILHSLNIILRMINNNKKILDKLPNGYIFTDTKNFLNDLKNGSTFSNINDLYKYVDHVNVFEELRFLRDKLVKLESEYEIYKNRNDIIEEISKDIDTLNDKLSGIVDTIERMNSDILSIRTEYTEKESILQIVDSILNKYEELRRLSTHYDDIQKEISVMYSNMEIIEQAVKEANDIDTKLINIDNELKPILEDRDSIKFAITRVQDYYKELSVYENEYKKLEIIKKYSSPTKAGIQNIFIDMYMGQTLNTANQLLSMFFNGRLCLLKYHIDDNEFRIPCTSLESPINNDDINSCSGGESAVISIVLSFALLQQSSTIYNIPRLDEMDATLDQNNKAICMEVIFMIMDMLKIESCIMISHSSESSLTNADIICLNMDNLPRPRGNIIYE